jgi:hypothetical protein
MDNLKTIIKIIDSTLSVLIKIDLKKLRILRKLKQKLS